MIGVVPRPSESVYLIGSENRDGIDGYGRGPPIGGYPRPSLTEIAKRVCNSLRPTPLIPAHRTRVGVTKTRVAVTLFFDPTVKGDLHPSLFAAQLSGQQALRVPSRTQRTAGILMLRFRRTGVGSCSQDS